MLKRMLVMLSWIPVCDVVASAAILLPLLAGGAAPIWAGAGAVMGLAGVAVMGRRRTLPAAIGVALVLLLAAFGGAAVCLRRQLPPTGQLTCPTWLARRS